MDALASTICHVVVSVTQPLLAMAVVAFVSKAKLDRQPIMVASGQELIRHLHRAPVSPDLIVLGEDTFSENLQSGIGTLRDIVGATPMLMLCTEVDGQTVGEIERAGADGVLAVDASARARACKLSRSC